MKIVKKAPHPVDLQVGARVRLGRALCGLSQEKLAEALGITFQQIQKYEKGTNRVAPSRLVMIAAACDKPVDWYYDGLAPAGAATDPVELDILKADPALIRDVAALKPDQREAVRRVVRAILAANATAHAPTETPARAAA